MNRATPFLLAAGALCAAATLLFGAELRNAIAVESLPAATPVAGAGADDGSVAAAPATGALTNEALMLAVDNDPFQPDRKRSPFRYRLPGDEPPAPAPQPPPPHVPPFRLIGTGSTAKGGVAVIEIENTARLVEVGESLLGFTLTAVSADQAVMSDSEQTVRLPLLASVAAAEPQRGNQRANERGNQRGQQPATRFQFEGGMLPQPRPGAGPEELRELMERVREMGGNMTPQMLQAIQRLQAEGRAVEVRTENGRMIIRTRPDTTDTQAPRVPNLH